MKLPCPACGAVCSLDSWFNDQASRAMVVAAAEAAEIAGARVVRYVGLFRPKTRSLSPDKAAKLFGEIRDLAKTREINWDRKGLRRIAPGMWQEAIDKVLERSESLDRPLSNHNYLRAIAYAIADEADRAADRQRVQAENSGTWRRDDGGHTNRAHDPNSQGLNCQGFLGNLTGPAGAASETKAEDTSSELWNAAKKILSESVSETSYEMWLRPLRVVSEEVDGLTLSGPNNFARRYVDENFKSEIEKALEKAAGKSVALRVEGPIIG